MPNKERFTLFGFCFLGAKILQSPVKMGVGLVVQVTTAVFISSGFHSAVVTCTNKDNSNFLSLLDKQPDTLYSVLYKA